ncbi:MAG: hypothetical protein QF886_26645, partial [Planctomycetota bacterium]|nr:hypothetical protein [Planctomycetota bacterium]
MPEWAMMQLAFLSILILGPQIRAEAKKVVFQENFNGYADGQNPSSIVEIRRQARAYGEVIGRRYAINMGENVHLLVMPRQKNFELSFTAEPH